MDTEPHTVWGPHRGKCTQTWQILTHVFIEPRPKVSLYNCHAEPGLQLFDKLPWAPQAAPQWPTVQNQKQQRALGFPVQWFLPPHTQRQAFLLLRIGKTVQPQNEHTAEDLQDGKPKGRLLVMWLLENTRFTPLVSFQPLFLNEVLVKMPADPSSDEPLFHVSHIDRVYTLKTETLSER